VKAVLAGSFKEYEYFIKINSYSRQDYIYISDPIKLRSYKTIELIRYGTWYERDYHFIREVELGVKRRNILDKTKKAR